MVGHRASTESDTVALASNLVDWLADSTIIPSSFGAFVTDGFRDTLVSGPGTDLFVSDLADRIS